jgi:hypothetical protein
VYESSQAPQRFVTADLARSQVKSIAVKGLDFGDLFPQVWK